MLEVMFRPRAVHDLEGIAAFLGVGRRSPEAASQVLGEIYHAIDQVAMFPESGSLFLDDDLARPYRRILARGYWIYYTSDAGVLTVCRVFHTSRDTEAYGFMLAEDLPVGEAQ